MDLELNYEPPEQPADLDTYLKQCVEVNEHDLNSEFKRVGSDLAFWTARLSEAYKDAATKKIDYERAKAFTRLALKEGGKTKMTAADLDAAVLKDDEVADAHIIYVTAEARRQKLKGVVDAIQAKKDMLQSLGSKLRAEMMSDPVLRERLAQQSLTQLSGL